MGPHIVMDTGFQIYAVCASLLALNLVFLGSMTGRYREKLGQLLNPEDLTLVPESRLVTEDDGIIGRYRRAHRNALESVPAFLIVALILVLLRPPAWLAAVLFVPFTVARLAHSLTYIKGLQPYRTWSYIAATVSFVAVIVTLLVKTFTS